MTSKEIRILAAKGKKKHYFILVLRSLFVIVGLSLLMKIIDVKKTISTITNISPWVIVAIICLESLSYIVDSQKIYILANHVYPLSGLWQSRVLSAFAGNFLPGVVTADVLRIFLIDRLKPGRKFFVALLLFTARIYGLTTLIFIFSCSLWLHNSLIPDSLRVLTGLISAFSLVLLAAPFIAGNPRIRRPLIRLIRFLRKVKIYHLGRKAYFALILFSSPKRLSQTYGISIIANLIVICCFWIIGNALHAQANFSIWVLLVCLSSFATLLPLGIGAIGTQDASLVAAAYYLNIPIEPILSTSIIMHFCRIVGTLPGIFFINQLTSFKKNRQVYEEQI